MSFGEEETKMKHLFIVNPAAGPENAYDEIRSTLLKYNGKLDYEIYITRARGDATRFVKEWCSTHGEKVRLYACGETEHSMKL